MMKGSAGILVVVLGLISAVVGFAILDSMSVDMMHPTTATQYSAAFVNATTYTMPHYPIYADSQKVKGNATCASTTMVENTNYTVADSTGKITLVADKYNNNVCGPTMYFDYLYEDTEYLSSSLSRTIMTYVVPVGVLGLLAVAAMTAI